MTEEEMTVSPEKPANSLEIVTFGCRLNTYESQIIRERLSQQGGSLETLVFNTCGVTAQAVRQAKQAIRKARRARPQAKIVVTGCAAQMDPSIFANMGEIDLILGNQEKLDPHKYLSVSQGERVQVNDIMSIRETASHLIQGIENQARAFVQVQNGCNHRCTFCRIPYGRGNSRSVPVGEIVQQLKLLVDQGCSEIVLTGVDITDYGKDLPGAPTLGEMVSRVLKLIPNLKRLRLSSLDPVEVDEVLFNLIVSEPRMMPHLHLSVQAGDDMILKRMKRRHLREDVISFCRRVRERRPDVLFGADLIAGFPTETEDMFQNTLALVKEADLLFLHVFPYSSHKETPAARMPQVASPVIKERAKKLRALGQERLEAFLKKQVGGCVRFVVEQGGRGHTDHFIPVDLLSACEKSYWGKIVTGQVVGSASGRLQVVYEKEGA